MPGSGIALDVNNIPPKGLPCPRRAFDGGAERFRRLGDLNGNGSHFLCHVSLRGRIKIAELNQRKRFNALIHWNEHLLKYFH